LDRDCLPLMLWSKFLTHLLGHQVPLPILFLSEEETNSPQRIASSSSSSLAGGCGRILNLIGRNCARCLQRRFFLFLFVKEPLRTHLNQAPHHTAASWGSYWSNHHDLPDKILASARGEVDRSDDEERITKSPDQITRKLQPAKTSRDRNGCQW
jgi:hypothetical protein